MHLPFRPKSILVLKVHLVVVVTFDGERGEERERGEKERARGRDSCVFVCYAEVMQVGDRVTAFTLNANEHYLVAMSAEANTVRF